MLTLIETGEMLDLALAIIPHDAAAEGCQRHMVHELRKNILAVGMAGILAGNRGPQEMRTDFLKFEIGPKRQSVREFNALGPVIDESAV
jgi:hypothetical protein